MDQGPKDQNTNPLLSFSNTELGLFTSSKYHFVPSKQEEYVSSRSSRHLTSNLGNGANGIKNIYYLTPVT